MIFSFQDGDSAPAQPTENENTTISGGIGVGFSPPNGQIKIKSLVLRLQQSRI